MKPVPDKCMKIALVNPPFPQPYNFIYEVLSIKEDYCFPLSLGYIAAYVRRAGHTVKIFDPEPCGMPLEVMWKNIEEFKPDLVGFTAVTPNFMEARKLVAEAKRRLGCLVVMGGPHANALPRSTLQGTPGLDAVILGEGEIPMLAAAGEFAAHGKVDFNRVPGAAFIENWKYKETPRPEPIADLDGLPYPARDLLDINLYRQHRYILPPSMNTTLISSRGCPSQCTFCANITMGRRFRAHSPEYVVGEMEYLIKTYGATHIKILDDCFTADPKRACAICDLMIAKKLNITWDTAGRVNTMQDESLVRKMKEAGCVNMHLGIETGNQRILDLMKKGTTLEMAEKCCALLHKYGVVFSCSFIIGNEGDTEGTINDTIAFAKKLKSALAEFLILIPFPGTPLFDKYYKEYDKPDTDWQHWHSQELDRPEPPRQTALTMEDLQRLQDRAKNKFYNDPVQFVRSLIFGVIYFKMR